MFIVSTFELFSEADIKNCDGVTALYFLISLFYLFFLAIWTLNLFRFYKISSNLHLHTLTTYVLCIKTIVTVVKYNEFVSYCTTGYSSGLYSSLWILFEFILSIISCLFLILISKGWGIVHVYLNPNDMKSATYLSICISFFALILSDRNIYTLIFIIMMYFFVMNILVTSSKPIIESLRYYIDILKSHIPRGDFTNHHNTLKLNLISKLVSWGCIMMIFSMIMYILSSYLNYLIWMILDECADIISLSPMIHALRLRVIKNFGIQPINNIERDGIESIEINNNNSNNNNNNGSELDMCVNNQPELQKFYLIVQTKNSDKHIPIQTTTLLAEVIEN
ncbi:hypothetical protein BCR36DRAFT_332107 [Piromyces finnis]|uniref:Uncharacterized protein n=1 Tax=Piromyces finnis TaxID=1754191 RepID=A0A1Y1V521_9FUNG|nr:hypothetical protein BCR36DRAFT_332107 [Piromyces finnis]|eukprot:ORX46176.1 hypothetical protein BCR36DRAFT_332107 [Piromyces finnis]